MTLFHKKTKPWSKVVNTIKKCLFSNSHFKEKTVYVHQIVLVLLFCDGLVLAYLVGMYNKNNMSEIDADCNIIKSLTKPVKV
ncbi:hypothetical protein [Tepidibacter mesophilus]|uniref:hypothetical protein n=1 Tax=Tepidibacter mesophilus TaxID=655607 RepID=UPI000C082591|nr:hypothetical protein [Tepidibacter mesophilus]